MEIFNSTLTQMLVMFSFIIIGFVLKKKKLLPGNSANVLSKLENYVLVPALVIDTFMTYFRVESLVDNYKLIVYSLLLLVVALVIALPLARLFAKEKDLSPAESKYRRRIYEYALTIGNFSFLGNALALGVLGDEGLFDYLLFTLALNVTVYTWGVFILIPEGAERKSLFKNLLNPVFVSLVLGLVLGLFGIKSVLPPFVNNTISSAKSCMAPVAMILTGFVIGGYDIKDLLTKKRVYTATALRLIVIPAVMLLLLRALGADSEIMTLTVFAYAAPLGLNTVVFPAAYGGDTKTGAAMAMISHTFAVITLPLMYLLFVVVL